MDMQNALSGLAEAKKAPGKKVVHMKKKALVADKISKKEGVSAGAKKANPSLKKVS